MKVTTFLNILQKEEFTPPRPKFLTVVQTAIFVMVINGLMIESDKTPGTLMLSKEMRAVLNLSNEWSLDEIKDVLFLTNDYDRNQILKAIDVVHYLKKKLNS